MGSTLPDVTSQLAQIALDVSAGDTVLFVGSGFSRSCPSALFPKGLPTADTLKKSLAAELNIDDAGFSLEDVAEHFSSTKGPQGLFQFLSSAFTVTSVPEKNIAFANLPWRRIYTTNFDNSLEMSFIERRRQPVTYDLDNNPNTEIPVNAIIHLNGSILTANSASLSQKIRLAQSAYWDNRISDKGWLSRFHRDIAQSRCTVFVGYSLFDADIAKLLRANPSLSRKTFFIDAPTPNPIADTKLAYFGSVLRTGFEAAAQTIIDQASSDPAPDLPKFFTSFEKVAPPDKIKSITASEARQFYVSGVHLDDIAFLSPSERAAYVVDRDCQGQIIDHIRSGASRFLIHSKVGNGKSATLAMLSAALKGEGYDVFSYSTHSERLSQEVTQIASQKSAILFENAFGRTEDLRYICENVGPATPVIATARTAAFELRGSELRSLFAGNYLRFSLDALRSDERARLSEALLDLGFFGRFSSTPHRLPSMISDWGNDIRSLVLKLFAETDTGKKFKSLIETASNEHPLVEKVLVLFFLLVVGEGRSDVSTVDELLEISCFPIVHRFGELFREFFDVSGDNIQLRSSVVGEFCLQEIITDSKIIDVLIDVAQRQRGKTYANADVWPILQQFMRFGFIEAILTSGRKREQVLRYFESLRGNTFYKRRPHFWLQYAIAAMSLARYDLAWTYLQTARSLGEKIKNYSFRHLDNHTARYLLESRARDPDRYSDHYVAFLKASSTLINEIRTEDQTYYTARVARYLAEFFHASQGRLNHAETKEALRRLSILTKYLKQKSSSSSSGGFLFESAIEAVTQAEHILQGGDIATPIRGNDFDFVQEDSPASAYMYV